MSYEITHFAAFSSRMQGCALACWCVTWEAKSSCEKQHIQIQTKCCSNFTILLCALAQTQPRQWCGTTILQNGWGRKGRLEVTRSNLCSAAGYAIKAHQIRLASATFCKSVSFFFDCFSEDPTMLCQKCAVLTMGLGCSSERRRQSKWLF